MILVIDLLGKNDHLLSGPGGRLGVHGDGDKCTGIIEAQNHKDGIRIVCRKNPKHFDIVVSRELDTPEKLGTYPAHMLVRGRLQEDDTGYLWPVCGV